MNRIFNQCKILATPSSSYQPAFLVIRSPLTWGFSNAQLNL